MGPRNQSRCTAFEGETRIATGELAAVVLEAKAAVDRGSSPLIFDDETGETIEVDFRGTPQDVVERLSRAPRVDDTPRGPGRPKLGVVAREVTLLPRHWEWLNEQ